jgi:hypothetical protein
VSLVTLDSALWASGVVPLLRSHATHLQPAGEVLAQFSRRLPLRLRAVGWIVSGCAGYVP